MKKFYWTLLGVALLQYGTLLAQTDQNIPIRGLCIYIDYPDKPVDVDPVTLDSMFNDMDYQDVGINRSFRRYWYQETRRNYDIQHEVFYYTAPNPSTFYEGLPWYEGIELWRDALEWVIANYPEFDWDELSKWSPTDPFDDERPGYLDGAIRSVVVVSSVFGPSGIGAAHHAGWSLSNGAFVGRIQGSVLQAPWHPTKNLFVLFHESGHALFNLPDTYDYDASSGGTAKYSLMSAQGPDVEPVGAPFVFQHGWGYVKEPEGGTHVYSLPADGDTVVVIKNIHDPVEFFALEVRKNSTPGNSLFPAPVGLLIWHSDLKVHTHNTLEDRTRYAHYKHSIVQMDGLYELENSGSEPPINAGDIYLPGDEFSDKTTPNSRWWSGEPSGIEVKDIVLVGDVIQFTVVIPDVHEEHAELIPKAGWSLVSQTPSQPGYDGTMAFDDDGSTYYHVPWGSSAPRPHELVIDLGADYEISEFYYTANDNYSPPWEGRVKDYELFLSMNGVDWGAPVVAEQFFQTPYRQYALFPKELARYVRFSALNSWLDDVRTSVAEIDFRGKLSDVSATEDGLLVGSSSITFSPNPASHQLKIDGLEQDFSIRMFSPHGVLIDERICTASTVWLDVSDYPPGIWMIRVFDSKNQLLTCDKIIKLD